MLISNKKSALNDFTVRIKTEPLERCAQYKYLGVIIDKNLNWKSHIEYISSKISKACGALAKLRHSMNTKLLVEIYHALIHSYVKYGILTWGNAFDNNLNILRLSLNRAVRIMTFAPFGRVDLKPIFKELKILDVKCTNVLEKSKYMYKSKNHLLPVTIANHFEESSQVESHSYNLRSTGRPRSVVTRLLSSEKSIQISGERLWNKIPDSTKLFSSLSTFKRDMKSLLIEGII